MSHFLYLNNDMALLVTDLRDWTGAFINDAPVVVTLLNPDGTEVAVTGNPDPWPIEALYREGSEGDYVAIIPRQAVTVKGGRYIARVVADDGPGRYAQVDYEVRAIERKGREPGIAA